MSKPFHSGGLRGAAKVGAKKGERKSRMTPAALDELARRANAGENISGPFDLKTGKPLKQPVNDPDLHELAPVWKD